MIPKLLAHKKAIDVDLMKMCREWRDEWEQQYTPVTISVLDSLIDFLNRGGKRVRGSLAIESYYLHGGTDEKVAMSAARVIELVQAYLLIMDDIQDQSATRRGGPTVHVELASEHGDHYGMAQALNIEMLASHRSMSELMGSAADSDVKVHAAELLARDLSTTIVGQINDIHNQVSVRQVNEQDIIKTMTWKTAYYTFVGPLELGACLAGDDGLSERLRDYALNAGIAFQICDDILGTFGDSFESGKSADDDIREGKATLLTVYARKHASDAQRGLLSSILGNQDATTQHCDEVRQVLKDTGAREYALETAQKYANMAVAALGDNPESFLVEIVQSVVNRKL